MKEIRIVTVCVRGEPFLGNPDQDIKQKIRILKDSIDKSREEWGNIDVFVFPGGFFGIKKYIGPLPYRERVKVLSKTDFHDACIDLAKNSIIVAGVDSEPPKNSWELGDQLCVAWNKNGIVGIGRKIFPTQGESEGYACYENDFSDKNRIIKLPNGYNAVLCACYDMFGCSENYNNYSKRTKIIKNIYIYKNSYLTTPEDEFFNDIRLDFAKNFIQLLKSKKVRVGIAAIHFDPTRYWQCHGIDTCSAAIEGIAIGASHYTYNLPHPTKVTLASYKKPKSILTSKDKRKRVNSKNKPYLPKDYFIENDSYLVRLFEF